MNALRPLTGYRFRLPPGLALVPVAALSATEQAALPASIAGHAVVLRSARGGSPLKSVDHDAAALLDAIARDGVFTPPAGSARAAARMVALLVLDAMLELDAGAGYVRGVAAYPWIFTPCELTGTGRIARQSRAATIAASHVVGVEPERLWQRLYFYGRVPAQPRLLRYFPGRAALPGWLAGPPYGETAQTLRAEWEAVTPPVNNDRWSIWRRKGRALPADLRCKLYISPRWEDLPRTFRVAVETLAETGTPTFKVACDAHGGLRPDKMVAYFPSMDRLTAAATALAVALDGLDAHGVPFTAEFAGDGLLSWAIDPPATPGAGHPSWRVWVTRRLASALVAARAVDELPVAPWRYAFDRLSLDGVDPDSWVPEPGLFDDRDG